MPSKQKPSFATLVACEIDSTRPSVTSAKNVIAVRLVKCGDLAKLLYSFSRPRLVVFGAVCGSQHSKGGKYVSSDLVYSCWFDCGRDRQVNHARSPRTGVDDSSGHYRLDPWRVCDAYVFPPKVRRPVPPCRLDLFNSRRPSCLICLLQA